MRKGEQTKQLIVERAADVFSLRGFWGTSMGDLTRETGLEKGGIYNHFSSKEVLALAAFDHAVALMEQRFAEALVGKERALDRLLAITDVFRSIADEPPVLGGCMVLNTAIEADDTFPVLRERAEAAMTSWQRLIGSTVKHGVLHGELSSDSDPRMIATIMTSTLEGAVMLSKLYGDAVYMQRAVEHLRWYLHTLAQG